MYYHEISAVIAIILSLIGVFYSIRNAIILHKANQYLKTQIFEKRKVLIKELKNYNGKKGDKKTHILMTEYEFKQLKRLIYDLSRGSKYDKHIKNTLRLKFSDNINFINYLFDYCMIYYKLYILE
jgi:hypothetical protein